MPPTPHERESPTISLVVAAYEQPRSLGLALASLGRQTFEDFEVVVADDGSGTEVRSVVEAAGRRLTQPVHHVWHPHQGFRKTLIVNRAATEARGSILVFIDGDCILHRRFLERHHRRSRRGRVLAGRRVPLDPELTTRLTETDVTSGRIERGSFWWRRGRIRRPRRTLYTPWTYAAQNVFREAYPIMGSNFSLHRKDFAAVNGYDERIIGRGLEDTNLDLRLRLAGFAVKNIAGEALQYHLFHTSSLSGRDPNLSRAFRHPDAAWTPFGMHQGSH